MSQENFFQDMSPQKRSIRNVSLSKAGRTTSRTAPAREGQQVRSINVDGSAGNRYEEYVDLKPAKYTEGGSWGKILLWMVVVVIILGAAYYTASFFRTGLVQVKLATKTVSNVETNLVNLPVVFASQKTEVSSVVPAKSRNTVETAARGTIVVYNENTVAQDLIIRTRFQAENGKIYRIPKAISVPAAKNGVPGTLEVEVIADEAGDSYNQGLTTFTVPGLRDNADLYKKVYAKSKTAMSGGQKGEVNIASPEDISRVEGELQDTIRTKLLNQMRQSQSNILLDGLYKIEIEPVLTRDAGDDVEVVLQGSIRALLIDKSVFATSLAEKLISNHNGEEITIVNLDSLKISSNLTESDINNEVKTVSVNVSGSPAFVYVFNQEAFKNRIAGKSSGEVNDLIAAEYKSIESATSRVSPAWYRSLPSDVSRIRVDEIRQEI